MDTTSYELGALPNWYESFILSPLGLIAAFSIVVAIGLLFSHKEGINH